MSRLTVHPTKSYNSPIGQSEYYFLVYSIVFINSGFYPISNVPFKYTVTITVPI